MINRLSKGNNKYRLKKEQFILYKGILRYLFNKKNEIFHENKIVVELYKIGKAQNETGFRNKPPILKSISELEKIGLIKKGKKGKQKIIITLTDLGNEIGKVIEDLQKYNESYLVC